MSLVELRGILYWRLSKTLSPSSGRSTRPALFSARLTGWVRSKWQRSSASSQHQCTVCGMSTISNPILPRRSRFPAIRTLMQILGRDRSLSQFAGEGPRALLRRKKPVLGVGAHPTVPASGGRRDSHADTRLQTPQERDALCCARLSVRHPSPAASPNCTNKEWLGFLKHLGGECAEGLTLHLVDN